ncbi:unnamed protein product [Meloidogyne enterolobii]|uniref:Uncharacterized protein n=1 Tax=Meloidogyne enterolobii TaxID=390850 RepID=A0ACB0ZJC1_MELEN
MFHFGHTLSPSTTHHLHRSSIPSQGGGDRTLAPPQQSALPSSLYNLNDVAELSAERLNLYIDRQEASERVDVDEQQQTVTFRDEPKNRKELWKQRFRIALPHFGLILLSAAYTLLGAAIFHHFETPNEKHIRNETAHRVQLLKDRAIVQLWTLTNQNAPNWSDPEFIQWANFANNGMNAVIRDVFIDYTKNYMTPDEIIYGSGPTKWSFGSSIFFSWTAITTIGYGHIVPLTIQGRISCLLYALFGIPLILVTIADMGRFLSNGIVWIHSTLRIIRRGCYRRLSWFFRFFLCRCCIYFWRRRMRRRRLMQQSKAAKALTKNKSATATTIAPSESTVSGSSRQGEASRQQYQSNHIGPNSGALATIEEMSRETVGPATDTNNNEESAASDRLKPPNLRLAAMRRAQKRLKPPPPPPQLDTVSEAGTFQDVSDIKTVHEEIEQNSEEDTRARADELEGVESSDALGGAEEEELEPDEDYGDEECIGGRERRVSVLFILVVMLCYTAGGACLMQLWERWSFVDAFYFCFVTVTTIGFGDIVPQNVDFLPATLAYIVVGLIITTMCIDLVGSEYIKDIHFYGRTLGRSFLTIGGKVIHLGEVFSYVAFLQKNYGLTPDQLDRLAQLPEEYLLDCLLNGRQPDVNWIGGRPFIPPDIYYFKWIEQPRTLSFNSDRQLASSESLELNTSLCSTARTLTPREYYQRVLIHYCRQMQADAIARTAGLDANGAIPSGAKRTSRQLLEHLQRR